MILLKPHYLAYIAKLKMANIWVTLLKAYEVSLMFFSYSVIPYRVQLC